MSVRQSLGPWKPDDSVSECDRCQQPFTVTRRRHHCRCCGCIFCYNCCSHYAFIPEVDPVERQRVCTDCSNMLRSRVAPGGGRQSRRGNDVVPHGVGYRVTVPSQRATAVAAPGMCATLAVADQNALRRPTTEQTRLDRVHASSSSDDDDDDDDDGSDDDLDDDLGDSEDSDDVNVSSAISRVLSSWDEHKTNSISFLTALQGNLVASDAPNVLSVLLFPSDRCYCVNVVTVGEEETMQQLADRMAEHFFKLSHGPFEAFGEKQREELRQSLRFSTEMQLVDKAARAVDVATQSRHVVLSTLSLDELEDSRGHLTGSAVSSLRDFFNSERPPVSDDELVK